mgnify:CR=1 FL=1
MIMLAQYQVILVNMVNISCSVWPIKVPYNGPYNGPVVTYKTVFILQWTFSRSNVRFTNVCEPHLTFSLPFLA